MPLQVLATLLLVAATDPLPSWDVGKSCQGASSLARSKEDAAKAMQSCLGMERRAREGLDERWSSFPLQDRKNCVQQIHWFSPNYTELATCLEFKQQMRKDKEPAQGAPTIVKEK